MFADYECKKCGRIYEYRKPYGEDFPAIIELDSLSQDTDHLKCSLHRLYNSSPVTSIARGSSDSDGLNYTYEPSPLTPLNKIHGRDKYNATYAQ